MSQIEKAGMTPAGVGSGAEVSQSRASSTSDQQGQVASLRAEIGMLSTRVAELDRQVAELQDQSSHIARGWRLASATVFLGILALTYIASLSDLAPTLLRRVENRFGLFALLPFSSEATLHFGGWMLAMIFAGFAVRSFPVLLSVAVTLYVAGISVEVLQHEITSTRQQEWGDVIANSLGIGTGLLVIIAVRVGIYLTDPRRSLTVRSPD